MSTHVFTILKFAIKWPSHLFEHITKSTINGNRIIVILAYDRTKILLITYFDEKELENCAEKYSLLNYINC